MLLFNYSFWMQYLLFLQESFHHMIHNLLLGYNLGRQESCAISLQLWSHVWRGVSCLQFPVSLAWVQLLLVGQQMMLQSFDLVYQNMNLILFSIQAYLIYLFWLMFNLAHLLQGRYLLNYLLIWVLSLTFCFFFLLTLQVH